MNRRELIKATAGAVAGSLAFPVLDSGAILAGPEIPEIDETMLEDLNRALKLMPNGNTPIFRTPSWMNRGFKDGKWVGFTRCGRCGFDFRNEDHFHPCKPRNGAKWAFKGQCPRCKWNYRVAGGYPWSEGRE